MALRVAALAGGVGGAKLVDGLAACLPPSDLTVIVNTGDDLEHLGLVVCPDLDTIVYTLAGLANPETGWGRAGETWSFLETMASLGGETWFRLGDKDLAMHVERTRRIRQGQSLSEITEAMRQALGVRVRVLPMSDDPVRTIVETNEGPFPFQEYFVDRRCGPAVRSFRFAGVESSRPAPGVLKAISDAHAVLLCPSNPWVSLDPILALPGVPETVSARVVVAVSPIVGGKSIRGPAAKMFHELGIQPSARAVAEHYSGLLTGLVIDRQDSAQEAEIRSLGIRVLATDIVMRNAEDRRRLSAEVLEFASRLAAREPG
jgi:LPPG:FO 2-phospho-L-lactate transferase